MNYSDILTKWEGVAEQRPTTVGSSTNLRANARRSAQVQPSTLLSQAFVAGSWYTFRLVKDLVLVDPETGKTERLGVILKKRAIGEAALWLTYDEADRMWWIVVSDDRLRTIGYIEARREVCWETFDALDEAELDKLRSWRPGQA